MEYPPPHNSYDDWYATGPYQEFLISRAFDRKRGVAAVMAQRPSGDYPDPPCPHLVLVTNTGTAVAPANINNSVGSYRSSWASNSSDFVVPGAAYEFTVDRTHRGLFTAFNPQFLSSNVDMDVAPFLQRIDPLLARGVSVPFLASILRQLLDEMGKADDPGGLFVDGALAMIGARLLRLTDAVPGSVRAVALSEYEKLALLDAIENQLDADLPVETLAVIVDRPVGKLHKLFKEAFGQSPHGVVLERRIAYACGFSSPQHMTNTFAAKLGVSPGKYR